MSHESECSFYVVAVRNNRPKNGTPNELLIGNAAKKAGLSVLTTVSVEIVDLSKKTTEAIRDSMEEKDYRYREVTGALDRALKNGSSPFSPLAKCLKKHQGKVPFAEVIRETGLSRKELRDQLKTLRGGVSIQTKHSDYKEESKDYGVIDNDDLMVCSHFVPEKEEPLLPPIDFSSSDY